MYQSAQQRVIAYRQGVVQRLANESGWNGSVKYVHEAGSSTSAIGSPSIVLRQHAFYEPGGAKSVYLHELGHQLNPSVYSEAAIDRAAAGLADDIYGHSDDIILPFVD